MLDRYEPKLNFPHKFWRWTDSNSPLIFNCLGLIHTTRKIMNPFRQSDSVCSAGSPVVGEQWNRKTSGCSQRLVASSCCRVCVLGAENGCVPVSKHHVSKETTALRGAEWSASRCCRFMPGNHVTGGRTVAWRGNLSVMWIEPPASNHFTDWVILAHQNCV
jgi:hypothetical protein